MAGLVVEVKSNTKANKFRDEGNASYRKNNFFGALIHYNKSLCFAETSEVKSLAYANRSSVYFETEKYQLCLDNIQHAREHGYPEEKLSKLDEREVKCHDLMKVHRPDPFEDPRNFFKLSYPANKKLPFIVDCLELKEDPKYGRLIATNRDLKPGDIVLIEEPWFKFLYLKFCYERCSNCMKEEMLNLIPCNGQCVNTMFCSEECAKSASFRHRQIECGFPMPEMRYQKLVIDSINIAGGVNELQACIKANEKLTIFDIDMTNPEDPQVKKQQLMAFLNLYVAPLGGLDETPVKEIAENLGLFLALFYSLQSTIQQNMPRDHLPHLIENLSCNHEPFLETTLRLVLVSLNVNANVKPNFEFPENGGLPKYENVNYGSSILLCGSLFNHSCDPNVDWYNFEDKFVAVVRYPIKAGEQLFVCYRNYFYHEPLEVRRKALFESSYFLCECTACIKDYSPFVIERTFDSNCEIPYDQTQLCTSELIENFKKNCECIQKNFKNHPCRETIYPNFFNKVLLDRISKLGFIKGSLKPN